MNWFPGSWWEREIALHGVKYLKSFSKWATDTVEWDAWGAKEESKISCTSYFVSGIITAWKCCLKSQWYRVDGLQHWWNFWLFWIAGFLVFISWKSWLHCFLILKGCSKVKSIQSPHYTECKAYTDIWFIHMNATLILPMNYFNFIWKM